MKKLIALIMLTALLLTGTMVYAEEASNTDKDTSAKINVFKDLKEELKPILETIRSNRTEIVELRQEATALFKESKKKVKELLKSKDDLSPVQIEAIKQSVDILVDDKKLMVETKGDIFKESIDLRIAKRNRNIEAYKDALDNIISIQNTRIDTLNKVIEDLKEIGLI